MKFPYIQLDGGRIVGRMGEYYATLENANVLFTRELIRRANAHTDLVAALELISDSDKFRGGTFVRELQSIARATLAKAKA